MPNSRKPGRLGNTEAIADRLVFRLNKEAAACLRAGLVEDRDLLDAGVIFGAGFVPFRGSPLYFARSAVIHRLHDSLSRLGRSRGGLFGTDAGFKELKAI